MRRFARRNFSSGGYDQNMGKAGVIYILENDGLRSGWVKIGCSSRSGAIRAAELNTDANTGTPGVFRCVFESRTLDCGRAERLVFKELSSHRRGKWGQEFFEVEIGHAKAVIRRVCAAVDDAAAPPPPPPRPPKPAPSPSAALPPPRPPAAPPVFRPPSRELAAATPSMAPAPIPTSPIRLRWVLVAVFVAVFLWVKLRPGIRHQMPTPPVVHSTAPAAAPKLPKNPPKRPSSPAMARATGEPMPSASRPAVKAGVTPSPMTMAGSSGEISPSTGAEPTPVSSAAMRNYFDDPDTPAAKPADTPRRVEPEPSPPPAALSRADLTKEERISLETVCSSAKFNQGVLAYQQCIDRHILELARVPRQHDLSGMDARERQSLNSVCMTAKVSQGPAAYNLCIDRQLQTLQVAPRTVDLSGLNRDEQTSLDSACSHAKYTQGPAAYNNCRARMLDELSSAPGPVDLSRLSQAEHSSIYSACSHAKYSQGPAALRTCLSKQMQALSDAPAAIDLRSYPREIRTAIESPCSRAKYSLGPAEYNRCIVKQVGQLRGAP